MASLLLFTVFVYTFTSIFKIDFLTFIIKYANDADVNCTSTVYYTGCSYRNIKYGFIFSIVVSQIGSNIIIVLNMYTREQQILGVADKIV